MILQHQTIIQFLIFEVITAAKIKIKNGLKVKYDMKNIQSSTTLKLSTYIKM
jgi:hypothetical protein